MGDPTADTAAGLRRRVEEAATQFSSSAGELRGIASGLGWRARGVAMHLDAIAARLEAASEVLRAELRVGVDASTAARGADLGRRAVLFGLLALTTGAAEHLGAEILDVVRGEHEHVATAAGRVVHAANWEKPQAGEPFVVSIVEVGEEQVLVDYVDEDGQALIAVPRSTFASHGFDRQFGLAPGQLVEIMSFGDTAETADRQWVPVRSLPPP